MKYTIDNPKLVEFYRDCEGGNFTGVVKDKDGNIAYYKSGKYHRTDGPAVIRAHGDKWWLIHNKLHREDGPAIEYVYGERLWYYDGKGYGRKDDFTVESWIKKCRLEMFK